MARQKELVQVKVVGVGGCGCNTVSRMLKSNIRGVDFVMVNTDAQSLNRLDAPLKVRIGDRVTGGKGAGGDPEVGRQAVDESRDELEYIVGGADMVFVTAGMGGGTGTGAAPAVAQAARQSNALTIAVVTTPFSFEGTRRRLQADTGIGWLKDKVDTLIVVPNDALLKVCDHRVTMEEAFGIADGVLQGGIQAIAEIITVPGEINLDFADVRAILSNAGPAMISVGVGQGETRARDAAKRAISSPMLETSIAGATGLLFNITAGGDLTMWEINEAARIISRAVAPNANIIFGMVTDPKMDDQARVTLVASGFPRAEDPEVEAAPVEDVALEAETEPAPEVRRSPRHRTWRKMLALLGA